MIRPSSSHLIPARLLLAGLTASLTLLPACGSGSSSSQRPRSSPLAGQTAAEAYPTSADALDFFDELEARDTVSNDDALHAILLVSAGRSGDTWERRVAAARRAGLVGRRFDPDPAAPVTLGDSCLLAARSQNIRTTDREDALRRLARMGLVSRTDDPDRTITGAEFVGMMSAMAGRSATANSMDTQAADDPGSLESFDDMLIDEPAAADPRDRRRESIADFDRSRLQGSGRDPANPDANAAPQGAAGAAGGAGGGGKDQ